MHTNIKQSTLISPYYVTSKDVAGRVADSEHKRRLLIVMLIANTIANIRNGQVEKLYKQKDPFAHAE